MVEDDGITPPPCAEAPGRPTSIGEAVEWLHFIGGRLDFTYDPALPAGEPIGVSRWQKRVRVTLDWHDVQVSGFEPLSVLQAAWLLVNDDGR